MKCFNNFIVLFLILFFAFDVCLLPLENSENFQLDVIHFNDFHAKFEETDLKSRACNSNTTECIGGISRLFAAIFRLLKEKPNALLLNAGDNFQGSIWYTLFKWNVTQYFLNKLPTDAIALGNHEFDDKIKGVVPFIKHLKAPVIASNIDASLEAEMEGTFKKSVVVKRNGKKIGIIGVTTSSTKVISTPENLVFLDEIKSVNKEAERLVREENVFTNVILSHAGYQMDQVMAANSRGKISLIIGGHTHSFLYSGGPVPGPDKPVGPYPTIVKNEDDKNVVITQASAFAKYLGNISVTYNKNGDAIGWSGSPIFLSHDMPQDEEINKEMQLWRRSVENKTNQVIGYSEIELDVDNCRVEECLLGDLVTDSMAWLYKDPITGAWPLAIINAGGVRTSLPKGELKFVDTINTLPFGSTVDKGSLKGSEIREIFDYVASDQEDHGIHRNLNLLQLSGLKVSINLENPVGSRIQFIKVRTSNPEQYEDLNDEKTYQVVMNSFLRGGGEAFEIVKKSLKNVTIGSVDCDVLSKYIQEISPIRNITHNRITIKGKAKFI